MGGFWSTADGGQAGGNQQVSGPSPGAINPNDPFHLRQERMRLESDRFSIEQKDYALWIEISRKQAQSEEKRSEPIDYLRMIDQQLELSSERLTLLVDLLAFLKKEEAILCEESKLFTKAKEEAEKAVASGSSSQANQEDIKQQQKLYFDHVDRINGQAKLIQAQGALVSDRAIRLQSNEPLAKLYVRAMADIVGMEAKAITKSIKSAAEAEAGSGPIQDHTKLLEEKTRLLENEVKWLSLEYEEQGNLLVERANGLRAKATALKDQALCLEVEAGTVKGGQNITAEANLRLLTKEGDILKADSDLCKHDFALYQHDQDRLQLELDIVKKRKMTFLSQLVLDGNDAAVIHYEKIRNAPPEEANLINVA